MHKVTKLRDTTLPGVGAWVRSGGLSAAMLEQHDIGSSAERYCLPGAVVVPAWRVGQKSGRHQGGTMSVL